MKFNKNKCLIVDNSDKYVMEGVQSTNNCYLFIPDLKSESWKFYGR